MHPTALVIDITKASDQLIIFLIDSLVPTLNLKLHLKFNVEIHCVMNPSIGVIPVGPLPVASRSLDPCTHAQALYSFINCNKVKTKPHYRYMLTRAGKCLVGKSKGQPLIPGGGGGGGGGVLKIMYGYTLQHSNVKCCFFTSTSQ